MHRRRRWYYEERIRKADSIADTIKSIDSRLKLLLMEDACRRVAVYEVNSRLLVVHHCMKNPWQRSSGGLSDNLAILKITIPVSTLMVYAKKWMIRHHSR